MLFNPGQIGATPAALAALERARVAPQALLTRHFLGDWGNIDPEDPGRNERSLRDGSRLLSVYDVTPDLTVWIITEAEDDNGNRSATTLLLPSEY